MEISKAIESIKGELKTKKYTVFFNDVYREDFEENLESSSFEITVKTSLSAEEMISLYNYIANNMLEGFASDSEDEDSEPIKTGFSPVNRMIFQNVALVAYYVQDEEISNLTIDELWNLICKTNIMNAITNVVNTEQIGWLNQAINVLEKTILNYQHNVPEQLISTFAGFILDLSNTIDNVNGIIDVILKNIEENGVDFNKLPELMGYLKEGVGNTFLGNILSGAFSNEKGDENGSSKKD